MLVAHHSRTPRSRFIVGLTSLVGSALLGSPLLVLTWTTPSHADEPIQPTEPRVLRDTSVDLLEIADAFDDDDPFDFNIRLGFEHDERTAGIRRETALPQPGLTTGGYTSDDLRVGTYKESTERLVPEINIGILPDVALKVRLPIILAHNRRIDQDGSGSGGFGTMGLAGENLFSLPFQSPTRSGIEYLAIGGDLALMNQFRNPAQPTWVIGAEGRFNVSEPMHACNRDASNQCTHPADINRNGQNDRLGSEYGDLSGDSEGDFTGLRSPGVSRGTMAIEGHAYVSKRLKYIEPYSGVSALFEFPAPGSDYAQTDLRGSLVSHPPFRGSVTAGLVVVPWEQPEKYQRISFDLRAKGTYVSEGRDYSELFDALGSSSATSLRQRNYAEYTANLNPNDPGAISGANPSIADVNSQAVYFSGLTDVQQHGDYLFSGQFSWQAGRYIRFDLGASLRVIQAHFITFDQACNPNVLKTVADVTGAGGGRVNDAALAQAGSCRSQTGTKTVEGVEVPTYTASGVPNPEYRRAINEPGHRYKVDTSFGFGAWLRASVMF